MCAEVKIVSAVSLENTFKDFGDAFDYIRLISEEEYWPLSIERSDYTSSQMFIVLKCGHRQCSFRCRIQQDRKMNELARISSCNAQHNHGRLEAIKKSTKTGDYLRKKIRTSRRSLTKIFMSEKKEECEDSDSKVKNRNISDDSEAHAFKYVQNEVIQLFSSEAIDLSSKIILAGKLMKVIQRFKCEELRGVISESTDDDANTSQSGVQTSEIYLHDAQNIGASKESKEGEASYVDISQGASGEEASPIMEDVQERRRSKRFRETKNEDKNEKEKMKSRKVRKLEQSGDVSISSSDGRFISDCLPDIQDVKTIEMVGDGYCGYRAMSYVKYGSQDNYLQIKNDLETELRSFESWYRNIGFPVSQLESEFRYEDVMWQPLEMWFLFSNSVHKGIIQFFSLSPHC